MKIEVYYEDKNNPTVLDVPDDQCEIWVENDYRRRLAAAEDKSTVERRTAQQIMNEDFNNPTFNNNQTETRRHVSLDALDPEDKHIADDTDLLKDLIGSEDKEKLYAAIKKLQPQQIELLVRVYFKGEKQKDIANEEGVSNMAITNRLKKIYGKLKKILEKGV